MCRSGEAPEGAGGQLAGHGAPDLPARRGVPRRRGRRGGGGRAPGRVRRQRPPRVALRALRDHQVAGAPPAAPARAPSPPSPCWACRLSAHHPYVPQLHGTRQHGTPPSQLGRRHHCRTCVPSETRTGAGAATGSVLDLLPSPTRRLPRDWLRTCCVPAKCAPLSRKIDAWQGQECIEQRAGGSPPSHAARLGPCSAEQIRLMSSGLRDAPRKSTEMKEGIKLKWSQTNTNIAATAGVPDTDRSHGGGRRRAPFWRPGTRSSARCEAAAGTRPCRRRRRTRWWRRR